MIKLQGKDIYLAALEREHVKQLWQNEEYDFKNPTQPLKIGYSIESSADYYEDIQKRRKDDSFVQLGIFLNDGTLLGDVALQDIDSFSRSCTVGMGISKMKDRNRGYGKQTLELIISHAFYQIGLERVSADTWEVNISAQNALEKLGFTLEGRARKAVYFGGRRLDVLHYGLLREEWRK